MLELPDWQRSLTADFGPPAPGHYRTAPEDFRVDEQLDFIPEGQGEHLWLRVEKRNLTTLEVVFFAGVTAEVAIGRVVTRFEFDRDQRRVIVERRALHFRRLKPVLEVIAFEHITEFVCEVHGERAHFRLEIRPTRHRASALNLGSALPPDLGLEQLRWLQPALGDKLYVRYVSLIDGRLQLQRVPYPPPQHPPIEPL